MTRPGRIDTTLPKPLEVEVSMRLSCSNWSGSKNTECGSSLRNMAELPDDVAVDRQNLIARREPRFLRGCAGKGLQHDDAPGQNRHHAAEALGGGGFHALELLELETSTS